MTDDNHTSNILIPFDDYVHSYDFSMPGKLQTIGHSGILSPLGWLNPKWNNPYNKRLQALRSIIEQMSDTYPATRRAVEWIALHDEEPTLRQIARQALNMSPIWIPA